MSDTAEIPPETSSTSEAIPLEKPKSGTKRGRGRPRKDLAKDQILRKEVEATIRSGYKTKVTQFKIERVVTDVYLPPPPSTKGSSEWRIWAMAAFKELVTHGRNFNEAVGELGLSRNWWDDNAKRDPIWAEECRSIRRGEHKTERDWPDISKMSYSEFAQDYLNLEVYPHQAKIVEALEDPQMNKLIVNGFPESGKSTHVALGYVLYMLCRNPDIRIALVSKMQDRARDLLQRVKRYLTEEYLYRDTKKNLIEDFKGFEPPRGVFRWDQDQITVRQRRSGERDPTIQALGVGTQIYGARIDLLILDDALTLENQHTESRREKINAWFLQEAASRAQRGQIAICGTRVHPFDNYATWSKAWENDPHFRKVIIPAIVVGESGEEVSNWPEYWPLDGETIWDKHNSRDFYQQGLRDIRATVEGVSPQLWRLAYQQENVSEIDAVFSEEHIEKALELGADRPLGQVRPEEILILGVDPAVTGRAASVLLAYNPRTRVRTVVDLLVTENLGASGIRQNLVYRFWEEYRPQKTVIEVNYAPTLMGDVGFADKAKAVGTLLVPHTTLGKGRKRGSKWDEEYGVAAMAPLFSHGLLALPSMTPEDRARLRPLIDDLKAFPYSDIQDSVMALWFAEGEIKYESLGAFTQADLAESRGLPPTIARRLQRSPRVKDRQTTMIG